MAINLLPSEHKSKYKNEKSALSASSIIEMTGPKKVAKKSTGIKKAGVLEFFKHPFQKPQKDLSKADSTITKLPEKKVILKEKISIQRPFFKGKPKVEFYSYQSKPESLKVKSSFSLGRTISGLFSRTPKHKLKMPAKNDNKIYIKPQEEFPKYKAVHAEKLIPKTELKPRQTEIIHVTANKTEHIQDQNKKKKIKLSVWARFSAWLQNLFGGKSIKQVPDKSSEIPDKDIPPRPPESKIIFETEESPQLTKEEKTEIPKPKVEFPVPLPKPPVKPVPIYTPPPPPSPPMPPPPKSEIKKEDPKKEIIIPEVQKHQPVKPPLTNVREVVEVTKKEEKLKDKNIEIKPKKKNQLSNWFKKLWDSIKKIFSKRQSSQKLNFSASVEESKKIKAQEKNQEKGESQSRDSKLAVPPPPIPGNLSESADSLPLSETDNVPKIDSEDLLSQPDGMPNTPLGLDWEVNLIPEEEMEKEIPISKMLYLAMSVIIAMAVVFGGWIWADYYFNTISTTISEIDAEISFKNSEINKFTKVQDDAEALQLQVDEVHKLLEKHVYWSLIFSKFEQYIIPEVYFKSMSADINGSVSLEAVAKNYESAIRQLFILDSADDFVTGVEISGISFGDIQSEQVSFSLSLKVLPTIFYYPR